MRLRSLRSDVLAHGANRVLRFLRSYASLDTSRKKGLARPMKWDEIPTCESASSEVKGQEFDLQWAENGGREYKEGEHGQTVGDE